MTSSRKIRRTSSGRWTIRVLETGETIENEAEHFFARLLPQQCPDWFNEDDYSQLKLIRDQWI